MRWPLACVASGSKRQKSPCNLEIYLVKSTLDFEFSMPIHRFSQTNQIYAHCIRRSETRPSRSGLSRTAHLPLVGKNMVACGLEAIAAGTFLAAVGLGEPL
jgi:hypothetical protein